MNSLIEDAFNVGEIVWSKYQLDIYKEIEYGISSICIDAVAGAAKTTVLVESANRAPKYANSIFLAFNKHIQQELEKRLPSHFVTKTLNGLGWSAIWWDANCNKRQIKLVFDKTDNIISDLAKTELKITKYRGVLRQLVEKAKISGVAPTKMKDVCNTLIPCTLESWKEIIKKNGLITEIERRSKLEYGTPSYACIEDQIVGWADNILYIGLQDNVSYDFADQVYVPFVLNLRMKKYDIVFVDEAQDISPIQMELISMCLSPIGRLICCGDAKQCLYTFRGAQKDALDQFAKRFNCKVMPLNICYRCSTEVVKEANKFNNIIEPWNKATVGSVIEQDSWNIEQFDKDDFILCRYNAPLVHVCMKLLEKKIPFRYNGRAFIQELTKIIRASQTSTVSSFYDEFANWHSMMTDIYRSMQMEEMMSEIDDKKTCLDTIRRFFTDTDPKDRIIHFLDDVFSNTHEGVLVSTVFRAKGLEADKVYFIDADLLPPDVHDKGNEIEVNLLYVGVTRAKKDLVYIKTDETFRSGFYHGKHSKYTNY